MNVQHIHEHYRWSGDTRAIFWCKQMSLCTTWLKSRNLFASCQNFTIWDVNMWWGLPQNMCFICWWAEAEPHHCLVRFSGKISEDNSQCNIILFPQFKLDLGEGGNFEDQEARDQMIMCLLHKPTYNLKMIWPHHVVSWLKIYFSLSSSPCSKV